MARAEPSQGAGHELRQRPDRAQPGQGAGPELRPRPDRAEPGQRAGAEPGQRPDMTVGQSTGRASLDHSQPVGGDGGGPEDFSHLTGSPGVEKRLEFTGYNPVVLSGEARSRDWRRATSTAGS